MSDAVAAWLAVWLAGTVILAYLAGASLLHANACIKYYSSPSPDDVKTRRYSARLLLASPIWPLLILAAVWHALRTLVRWAR